MLTPISFDVRHCPDADWASAVPTINPDAIRPIATCFANMAVLLVKHDVPVQSGGEAAVPRELCLKRDNASRPSGREFRAFAVRKPTFGRSGRREKRPRIVPLHERNDSGAIRFFKLTASAVEIARMNAASIKEHMDVIAADGQKV